MRTWVAAKLHGITVTSVALDYHGSVTIDRALIEQARIAPYEQCHVVNLNNGNRWVTYVLPGDEPGEFAVNGGGARLAMPGDRCVVMTYQHGTPHDALALELDDANSVTDTHTYQVREP